MLSGRALAIVAIALVLTSSIASGSRGSPAASHVAREFGPPSAAAVLGDSRHFSVGSAHPFTALSGRGVTEIEPNGTLSNASAPITVAGNSYTVTANFSGELLIARNGSTVQGGSNLLTALPEASAAVEIASAHDVRLSGLSLDSSAGGVIVADSEAVRIDRVTVHAPGWAVGVANSSTVSVTNLSASSTSGLEAASVSGLFLASDDLSSSTRAAAELTGTTGSAVDGLRANGSRVGVLLNGTNDTTVADNELNATGIAIEVNASEFATVSNNWLGASPEAMAVTNSSFTELRGNAAVGGSTGLHAAGDRNLSIDAVSYTGFSSSGGAIVDCTNVSVLDSNFSSPGATGLKVSGSNEVYLTGSEASGSVAAIDFEASSQLSLLEDEAVGALGSPSVAYRFVADQQVVLATDVARNASVGFDDTGSIGLQLSNDLAVGSRTGILLQNDSSVDLASSAVEGATADGLDAFGVNGLTVELNNFSGAAARGLFESQGRGLLVADNVAGDVGAVAFQFVGGGDVVVEGNRAYAASGSVVGVSLAGVTGGSVNSNNLTALGIALEAVECTSLTLAGNNLSRSGTGFSLVGDTNTSATANQLWNDSSAFVLSAAAGVWIYHNNFVSDGVWSIGPSAGAVSWDAGYPEGGNFWGNHTGPDVMTGPDQNVPSSIGDGIVDAPLVLGGSAEDRYPLAVAWTGYTIDFVESGLHAGTFWAVVVNGVAYSSGANTIYVPQQNGPNSTFWYKIPHVVGYVPATPSNGTGEDARGNLLVPIVFGTINYLVTVTEVGLPAGTPWTLVFAGHQYFLNQSHLAVSLANGTYTYLPSTVTGFLTYGDPGDVVVAGAAASVQIFYEPIAASSPQGASTPSNGTQTVLLVALGIAVVAAIAGWAYRGRPPSRTVAPDGPGSSPV
ncbi:MAG TPA: right-handed parallel beta-helix repeat-containing protein [Thermoplasmata archaeon]|nr:right-handed parallel beta-helix repeat-containing protein [Thermoplasmata archaeon]